MPITRLFKRKQIKGQLSIFAAIIFQTLFVLFAMSLNIALVVHDKINLQNSVDLAAYYGAMKQAEVLNAIAHINYQIRQSWKLMVWRNRVLGTIGSTSTSGLNRLPLTQPVDQLFQPHTYSPTPKNKSPRGPYVTCVAYRNWALLKTNGASSVPPSSGNDNFCNQIENRLRLVTVPNFTGVLGGLSSILNAMTNQVIDRNTAIQEQCKAYGYNSWFLAFFSVVYLQRDQSARKVLIYKLAKDLLSQGKDLDGKEIVTGAYKTFLKNLTYINEQSATADSLQTFNSLKNIPPNQWLEDYGLPALPLYAYIKGNHNECTTRINMIYEAPAHCENWNDSKCQTANQLKDQILYRDDTPDLCSSGICKMSAGLQKKKDFIVFFGASATLQYQNQIFLPGGPIKLEARAYAKPFGGRMGPPKTIDDRNLPTWPSSGTTINAEQFDAHHAPNYSRYPGDPLGLRSEYVHYLWANYLSSQGQQRDMKNYHFTQKQENDPDILAKDSKTGNITNLTARYWELAAIAPDLFDVSYFTILPSYMETYFPKIKRLFQSSIPGGVRGDLGYDPSQGINLEWQIKIAWNRLRNADPDREIKISSGNPFYNVAKLDQILTGWQAPKQKYVENREEYKATNPNRFPFSWCYPGNSSNNGWASGSRKIAAGCFYGGRTGYSVKMVSACSLSQNDLSRIDWYEDSECSI